MNRAKWRQRWKFLIQQGLFKIYIEQEITKISCHQHCLHLQNPYPKTFFAPKFNIVKKYLSAVDYSQGNQNKKYLLCVRSITNFVYSKVVL